MAPEDRADCGGGLYRRWPWPPHHHASHRRGKAPERFRLSPRRIPPRALECFMQGFAAGVCRYATDEGGLNLWPRATGYRGLMSLITEELDLLTTARVDIFAAASDHVM